MTLEGAIIHFGYAAVLAGTFMEGEVVLILAGFAAHSGYLYLPLVMAAAFLGTLAGDQLYFFIGRRRGRAFLEKHRNWEERIARFRKIMARHDTAILILFRFLYGLRTVAPFAIGLSDIPTKKFIIFNCISAAIWVAAISSLGYVFGQAVEAVLQDVRRYEIALMVGLAAAAVIIYLAKRWLNRKKTRQD